MSEANAKPIGPFVASLSYRDPRTAMTWLQRAFGFNLDLMIEDDKGEVAFGRLTFRGGGFNIGAELPASGRRSPLSLGGYTQLLHVYLESGIEEHCERARAAGARITSAPEKQFFGDISYSALDLEDHAWTFNQPTELLTPAEWDKRGGVTTTVLR